MGLKLKMTIDGAKHVDTGIWRATLEPEEATTLGNCESRSGPFSVLFIESEVDFNQTSQTITFDPNSVTLLNIGNTDQIIILSGDHSGPPEVVDSDKPAESVLNHTTEEDTPISPKDDNQKEKNAEFELSQTLATGDKLFLSELPVEVRDLGETLLSEIRNIFPGELNYEPRSAKFDETPEIFWTIKILPQDNALRLTVRGTPEDFETASGIDIQLDKFGYSAFHVNSLSQITGAISILQQAHQNME
jgi:hypothetical protein